MAVQPIELTEVTYRVETWLVDTEETPLPDNWQEMSHRDRYAWLDGLREQDLADVDEVDYEAGPDTYMWVYRRDEEGQTFL